MRVYIFILLTTLGCKIDHSKEVDRDKFTFKVGDDTELFFNNVRKSYYDLEENRAAKFNVFRFENRSVAIDQPIINLAIVLNYLQDEAYLLVEPNEFLSNENEIEVIAEANKITLIDFNHEAMLEFASLIYEALLSNKELRVKVDDSYYPLLDSQEEREAFRVTMADYYRLTRVY